MERTLGQAPLVSVGVINPNGPGLGWLLKSLIGFAVLLVLGMVAIAVVHTQVMPLDTYVYQAIYKFNLEG